MMVRQVLLLVSLLCVALTAHADVRAFVDRTVITDNETLELTIESTEGFDEPELDALRMSFDVISSVRGSQIQIVRGQVESKQQLVLTLAPRQTGEIRIPALKIGNQMTAPIAVKIISAATDPKSARADVQLEVTAEPKSAVVQEQIILTINLYHAIDLRDGQLTLPNMQNAIIERVGDDQKREEIRSGRRYTVLLRRIAVYPQASGTLRIPPVEFNGQALIRSGRSMNSFFNNPFGADPFDTLLAQAKPVRARSAEFSINVAPKPAEARGPWWLPARKISVSETWSPTSGPYHVGEPVTRTIVLQADGLTPAQLPEFTFAAPDGLKTYPDQPVNDSSASDSGIVATRTQKVAYVATQAGTMTLPRIDVEWWNTTTRHVERATLPARDIIFARAADGTVQTPTVVPAPVPSASSGGTASVENSNAPAVEAESDVWRIVAVIVFVVWVATLIVWWFVSLRKRGGAEGEPERTKSRGKNKASIAAVRAACKSGNVARVRDALINVAAARWSDAPPKSLGEIAARVTDDAVRDALWAIEQRLYKPGDDEKPLEDFCAALEKWIQSAEAEKSDTEPQGGLRSLYPQR